MQKKKVRVKREGREDVKDEETKRRKERPNKKKPPKESFSCHLTASSSSAVGEDDGWTGPLPWKPFPGGHTKPAGQ